MASLNDIDTKIQSIIDKLSVKTIKGTLPLTFTSHTAGAASDWEIEGNNSIGKNLLNIESTTIPQHMTIDNVDNSTGSIVLTAESGYTYRGTSVVITDLLEIGKTYEITLTKNNATPSEQLANATLRRVDTNAILASVGSAGFAAAGDKTFSYTHTQERAEQGIYFSLLVTGNSTTGGTLSISNLMIREATTSATFEPYQIGVGQRTKNRFDIDASTMVKINSQGNLRYGVSIGSALAGTYTLSFTNTGLYTIYVMTRSGTTYSQSSAITVSPHTITLAQDVDELIVRTTSQNIVTWESLGFTNIMLVEGSTAPTTFVPYGYEIPLTVNSSTQDIYIGGTPLTEGETVSKQSTGVDLELFEGENTVSTTLYNKPEMKINYKWR